MNDSPIESSLNPMSTTSLTETDFKTKLARLISNIISPIISGILSVGLLTFYTMSLGQAWLWMLTLIFILLVPLLAFVMYLVKIGYIQDIFLPDRRKRIKVISGMFVWFLVSFVILNFLQAPTIVHIILGAILVQVVCLWLITLLWKVSFHSAIITTATTIAFFFDSPLLWFLSPLVPLVAWARVHLKRHTSMQVIIGTIMGILMTTMTFHLVNRYVFTLY